MEQFLQATAENTLFQCGCVMPVDTLVKISDPNYVRRFSAFVQILTLLLKPVRALTSLMSLKKCLLKREKAPVILCPMDESFEWQRL